MEISVPAASLEEDSAVKRMMNQAANKALKRPCFMNKSYGIYTFKKSGRAYCASDGLPIKLLVFQRSEFSVY